MQNKLNEILELCVEKSDAEDKVFYRFTCDIKHSYMQITKYNKDHLYCRGFDFTDINQALEYMQNE